MDWVLVGLVIVGVGVYSSYKVKKAYDNYVVDYINYTVERMESVQETLDRLNNDD